MEKISNFRFWCQKVLPLVYDDSLSYYELLCKVVDYLNRTISAVNVLDNDFTELSNSFKVLKEFVDNYFDNLDVQEEVNKKLDDMAESGQLTNLIKGYVDPLFASEKDKIESELEAEKSKIDNTLAEQNNNINVLKTRMDTFSSLTEGSTTGDAELIDARIDNTGVKHPNVGDAIRNRFTDVDNDIDSIMRFGNPTTWVLNKYVNANGSLTNFDGLCYCEIDVTEIRGMTVNLRTQLYAWATGVIVDANGTVVYSLPITFSDQWYIKEATFTIPNNGVTLKMTCTMPYRSSFNIELDSTVLEYLNRARTDIANIKNRLDLNSLNIKRGTITSLEAPFDDLNTFPANTVAYYDNNVKPAHSPITVGTALIICIQSWYYTPLPLVGMLQIAFDSQSRMYTRACYGGDQTWSEWRRMLNTIDDGASSGEYAYTDIITRLPITSSSRLIFSGDSITFGITSDPNFGPNYVTGGYVERVRNALNCSVTNIGASASAFAPHPEIEYFGGTILSKLQSSNLNCDYLFIAGGTNDYGFYTEEEDFIQAIKDTFDYVDSNTSAKVILILPINRIYKPNLTTPLDFYREALFEEGIKRGYYIIDGSDFGFPNSSSPFSVAVQADGLHPTELGYKMYADALLSRIK